jgi:hypothetical protein
MSLTTAQALRSLLREDDREALASIAGARARPMRS